MREPKSACEEVRVFGRACARVADLIGKVLMVGTAKDEHPPARRGAFEQLVLSSEGRESIALRDEEERRNLALPRKGERGGNDPGERFRVARRCKRQNRPKPVVDLERGQRCPATEAPANKADALLVDPVGYFGGATGEHFVEEEAQVGHAVSDDLAEPRIALLSRQDLARRDAPGPLREVRNGVAGVIGGGNDVTVARKVRAKEDDCRL